MTIKFIHSPLSDIDALCKQAEQNGEKIMILVHTYKKVPICHHDDKGILIENEEDVLTGGWGGYQIRSSKDVFQFDNEDMKFLSKEDIEEIR